MTSRERVGSPDELRPGDRVELDDTKRRWPIAIDLLFRDAAGVWVGPIVVVPRPGSSSLVDGRQLRIGDLTGIDPRAYPAGDVFVRRRSREDHRVAHARVIRYCSVADLKGISGLGGRSRE